jgi:hypothetical protein
MNSKDTQNIIVDLVNKIKYEVMEEQMSELSGSATPPELPADVIREFADKFSKDFTSNLA